MWELAPEKLSDFPIYGEKVTINPWEYEERLGLYKLLLNITAPFLDMKEPGNKRNVLWGLPLQFGWQYHTGKPGVELSDKAVPCTCGMMEQHLDLWRLRWWWIRRSMNYYLAVIPFLGAIDAGLFEGFQYGISISPPDESPSDFCNSIEECRSTSTKAMDEWKSFFELIKTSPSEVSVPSLSKEEDKFLSYMWKAHVESIKVALPRCSKRLEYFSGPEGSFGKDWATAVEFIGACNFPTNFKSTNDFQTFLPRRILSANDKAPNIHDFSKQENRVLSVLHSINQVNKFTGGFLLRLWKKAMCSEEGRVAGRNLLQNMVTDPQLVPETMLQIIIELAKNSAC
ncbi:hypothetical protein GDO81_008154 [Engystomops pustulosus]|uniref:Uncharacterized protein n=1 Tax=Engystomops pustulosus TaxID=76066 RepID=A0AAV7CDG5_ENGPU|nr:hypothetical protein GDO81_008154 [Engystomops pustulosus]